MNIYAAGRNVMFARNADWHEKYTLPSLWDFYKPSRKAHGSYWFNWTTHDEIAWKKFYQVWMQFLNEYKNAGGRVTTGSDSGFIYALVFIYSCSTFSGSLSSTTKTPKYEKGCLRLTLRLMFYFSKYINFIDNKRFKYIYQTKFIYSGYD